jgi:polar amino acid transport system substrate-binding protein
MIKILLLSLALILPIQSKATTQPENQSTSTSKLSSVDDLKDKRIGVLMGSAHESYATKTYPQATILQYKSPADVILAVKTGKVDAALYDTEPLRNIIRQDNSLGMLGDALFSFDVGVGFNKNNSALKNRFNTFLAKIKEDGVYKDMVDRWMTKGETTMPDIRMPKINNVLVVGVSDAGLPFTIVKDNDLVGFDIELAKRFAASEGKDIKFSNMDFSSLISAVSSGKADMIASSIYVTDERKKQINFSTAYYEMGTNVFALKENIITLNTTDQDKKNTSSKAKLLNSLDDIKDKSIGVLLGSVHDSYAHKNYPNAAVLQYKSPSDLILGVKTGKVEVGLYVNELLAERLRDDQSLGFVGEVLEVHPVAYGFNKNNPELREKFNTFFKALKESGVYDDMLDRWIKKGNTKMPKINTPNINGELRVGHVSDSGLPFVTVKDNELIGLNIELTKRFAASEGKSVRFDDMEFGSIIPALMAGKIDFVGMTLMVTEERKTKIDFADPFYQIGMRAFALKNNIAAYGASEEKKSSGPSFFQGVIDSFNSNIIQEKRYLLLWDGLKTTVVISILATLFGTLLGSIICFLRMSKNNFLNIPAKIYISILRGTPVLVILMLIFYVVFGSVNINPIVVATIAFGMNFGAYAAEIFRSGIEGIEKGQMEAGIAMGFNKLNTFIYIILPQTVRRILPIYKGEFISLVKMTSIVGYIAVQDLTKASDIIRSRTFDAFFPLIMIAILYFLISWVLMQFIDYLEKITDPKYKRQLRSKS